MIFRILLFIAMFAFADDNLEIKALHMMANDLKGMIELNENVEIRRGRDELYASKVIINIDKSRMPTKYSAFGGVKFLVVTQDNRYLRGSADEVHYNALNGEYRLVGNGKVVEDGTINTVIGEEIIINNDVAYVNIVGSQKSPAKLIFKLEKGKQNAK